MARKALAFFLHLTLITVLSASANAKEGKEAKGSAKSPAEKLAALEPRYLHVCLKGLDDRGVDAEPVSNPEQVCECNWRALETNTAPDQFITFIRASEGSKKAEQKLQGDEFDQFVSIMVLVQTSCARDPNWIYEPSKVLSQ